VKWLIVTIYCIWELGHYKKYFNEHIMDILLLKKRDLKKTYIYIYKKVSLY